jgi:hypothetical protein
MGDGGSMTEDKGLKNIKNKAKVTPPPTPSRNKDKTIKKNLENDFAEP